MHCLLEGICGQEIAIFLNRIIYQLGFGVIGMGQ